jgi:hypothetical protein
MDKEKTWTIDWRLVDVDKAEAPDGDHDIESYSGSALVNGKKVKAWGNDESDGFQSDILADIAEEAASFLGVEVDNPEIDKILDEFVREGKITTIVAKGKKVSIKIQIS